MWSTRLPILLAAAATIDSTTPNVTEIIYSVSLLNKHYVDFLILGSHLCTTDAHECINEIPFVGYVLSLSNFRFESKNNVNATLKINASVNATNDISH